MNCEREELTEEMIELLFESRKEFEREVNEKECSNLNKIKNFKESAEKGNYKGFEEPLIIQQEQHQKVKKGLKGGYMMNPHFIYKELIPSLIKKYKEKEAGSRVGQLVRDSIMLLNYLHAYKYNGGSEELDNRLFGWSWPTDDMIVNDLGINGNRLKTVKEFLVNEKLVLIKKVKGKNGKPKDYYLPLYYPKD